MNRRELTLAFGAAALMFPQSLVVAAPFEQVTRAAATASPMQIAMLVHPDMVLLDLVGPHTVFSLTTADVHLVLRHPYDGGQLAFSRGAACIGRGSLQSSQGS